LENRSPPLESFVVALNARSALAIFSSASTTRDRDRVARGRERTLHFVFPIFVRCWKILRAVARVFAKRYRIRGVVCGFANSADPMIFSGRSPPICLKSS
jgi:hypothetical protein